MKTRITTNAEIKTILKLGSADDTLIDIYNDAATELLCELLGIEELAIHSVVNERIDVDCLYEIRLRDFPVDEESVVIKTTYDQTVITGHTFKKDPGNRFTLRSYNTAGTIELGLAYDKLLVSYNAGYLIQDTVEVISNTGLVTRTITVTINGTATTYTMVASGATGNQINIGATIADTAANIQAKLGGTIDSATVTLPLGSSIALGTATSAMLAVVNADIPKLFKIVIAYLTAGGMAEKDGNISSYTIGGKSVTFRTDEEGKAVDNILKKWIPTFQRAKIFAI